MSFQLDERSFVPACLEEKQRNSKPLAPPSQLPPNID
jgi:hypothetical protein